MTPHTAGRPRHPGAAVEEIAALGPFFAFTTYAVDDSVTDAAPRPAAGGTGAGADTGAGVPPVPGSGPGRAETGEWQPLDAPAVAARVTAVRQWLAAAGGQPAGSVEVRVAASVAHLGLAARLLSPELAAAVLHGTVPGHCLADVRWQPVLGGPAPLALPADHVWRDGTVPGPPRAGAAGPGARAVPAGHVRRDVPDAEPRRDAARAGAAGPGARVVPAGHVRRDVPDAEPRRDAAREGAEVSRPDLGQPGAGVPSDAVPDVLAGAFARRLGSGPLAELAALHAPFGVSAHILLGNTASALNGAAAMVAAARPDLAAIAAAFAADVLAREPLRAQADRAGGSFRRRSCCLIYRAAPGRRGALCGDCALRRPGGRP